MTRICMTLPQHLLQEFDLVLKNNGYTSRSKGLTDVIEEYINKHKT